jgi:hypothetical protein
MMRFNRGRAEIEEMLHAGKLERVNPSREHADKLLVAARVKLKTAASVCDKDPESAYTLLYDAARLALTAVLENEGLRSTIQGGHLAPYRAVMAQLDPPMGPKLRPFDHMRRIRHETEYPTFVQPDVTSGDTRADLPRAEEIVRICAAVLDDMSPF